MKKIFKGLSVLVASTALCAGIATATACSGGYNGTYIGEYHYTNEHNAVYGMRVEVTVENNIITKVRDITNTDLSVQSKTDYETGEVTEGVEWTVVSSAMPNWGWTEEAVSNWTDYESLLLQKYEGWSVADILDIKVYIKETGEVYDKDDNPNLSASDLVITGATQSSGRLILAIQDAFGKKTEIGRIG